MGNNPGSDSRVNENGSKGFLTARERSLYLGTIGLLVVATLLLYGPVVHHDFVNFDDPHYVTANAQVRSGLTGHSIHWAFTTFEMGHWHPLTWLSHMLDCQLFGLNPSGHHYSNVLLHTINALLLLFLLVKGTGCYWRSLIVASLFAVHPLNVENVAWVAERKTLLGTLLFFVTIASYGWYCRNKSWRRYLAVTGTFVLALMAKALAVTIPPLLLLIDYWPLARFGGDEEGNPWKRAFWRRLLQLSVEKVPLFLLCVAASVVAIIAQREGGAMRVSLPLSTRLENVPVSYVTYLQKIVWPTNLSVYYPHPGDSISSFSVILAVVLLCIVTALLWRFSSSRYLLVGWIWFLLNLLPVIGIVQVGGQALADRYAYVPAIGIFVIVVWGVTDLVQNRVRNRVVAATVAACYLAGFAVVSEVTLTYWQDSLTLFLRAQKVAFRPDPIIENNLGEAYLKEGAADEAYQHFEFAKRLDPSDALARYNIGTYLLQHGRIQESIPEFETAIQLAQGRSPSESSYNNLGVAYLQEREYELAVRNFTAALEINPMRFHSLVGRGQALYAIGQYEPAASDFARALQISPESNLFFFFGRTLEKEGNFKAALKAYDAALERDPQFQEARRAIAALQSKTIADQQKTAR